MKYLKINLLFLSLLLFQCAEKEQKEKVESPKTSEFASVSQVASGNPVGVKFTSYSTTLIADGKDKAKLRITVVDSLGKEITSAKNEIHISVSGDGKVTKLDGSSLPTATDTAGVTFGKASLENGQLELYFVAGTNPDKVKVEAKSGKLWPGAHEIHTVPSSIENMTPSAAQLPETVKPIDKMIGADISFLPQIEARGGKFYDNGEETDAIALLKHHGINYIRLRIFVNPENEKGYSPEKGFCGLDYTLDMAKRVKEAGLKLLLDFHYSDYWADPQQQYKPKAWSELDYPTLRDSVEAYTSKVLNQLKAQNTLPDMVQVGNEINHGMMWPEGHISNPDQLAGLLKSGIAGVNAVDKNIPIMLHIALGGQNKEARFWLDNMLARDVKFDIIGLSFYPRWHGTLDDLQFNLNDLTQRYHKPVNVVEYSDFKKEVHDIAFNIPNGMGKGAAIWEPLNNRSGLFTSDNEATDLFSVYEKLNQKYLQQ